MEEKDEVVTEEEEIVDEETDGEPDPEIAELRKQLEAEKKAKSNAEKAAAAANAERKKLERAQMSEKEQAEEKLREAGEKAKEYDRLIAGTKAREILVSTGLPESEYSPILELITSEDEENTKAIATEIKTILENQAKKLEKTLREKIMKENPQPPAGDGEKGGKDPFAGIEKKYNYVKRRLE